jgi:hypothetical protein
MDSGIHISVFRSDVRLFVGTYDMTYETVAFRQITKYRILDISMRIIVSA